MNASPHSYKSIENKIKTHTILWNSRNVLALVVRKLEELILPKSLF